MIPTIVLRNVKLCGSRKVLTDHLWFNLTKEFEMDWQPFSGHFFQRLRPAFLNSTGLM